MTKSLKSLAIKALDYCKEMYVTLKMENFLDIGLDRVQKVDKPVKKIYKVGDLTFNFVSLKDGNRAVGIIDKTGITVRKTGNGNIKVFTKEYNKPIITFYEGSLKI